MRADEMPLRVLRELLRESIKPLSFMFEKLWLSGKVPLSGEVEAQLFF